MKYTTEVTNKLIEDYKAGIPVKELAQALTDETGQCVPERSVIAKLSNLGVYQRKSYVNKRGEIPIKKEEYIERIAKLLDIDLDLMESLEKVTKTALMLMDRRISELKQTNSE